MSETSKTEVVFSFDTTGSMYPCLTQVRRNVKTTVERLVREIPGIRIGIIAHGDYCDAGSTYVIKKFELSEDGAAIARFVENVGPTGGGDAPECYELALHEAQTMSWSKDANKAFVLIGDDVPHPPAQNPQKLNWRDEVDKLGAMKIPVYGVQALGRSHATPFYNELANKSGGFHLSLDQFSHVHDMILAICYQQSGEVHLQNYEQEVVKEGRMNRGLNRMFDAMLKRASTTGAAGAVGGSAAGHAAGGGSRYADVDLRAVPPGRFQMLPVDHEIGIKEFVLENGLSFKTGRGFYEFTKTETIQGKKEIVLMDRASGDMFSGDKAREILGLPPGETVRIKPHSLEKYAVFVQSTSANRKLMGKTRFLYEVEDWTG